MLQQITVQNLAYFKDTQTLNFDPGHYFLIGENDSGKSSLFEIIRGCMGASESTSLSKPHDREKPSYGICCFRVCKESNEEMEVVSAAIRPRWEEEKREIYLKLVHIRPTCGGEIERFEIEYLIADEISGNNLAWKSVNHLDNKAAVLEKLKPDPKKWHKSPDDILNIITEHINPKSLKRDVDRADANECEELLRTYINKTTVVTFPLRGISPCQWTKSKRLKQDNIQMDIEEEIVTWYLKKLNDKRTCEETPHTSETGAIRSKTGISPEEERKEKEYFRLITNNSDFDFSYDNGKLIVKNAAFQDPVSLILKIPEGIYAAKKMSVILAVKQFQTVCLEEPDRGMHPQMIGRIRDLVLPQITNKVILITSHHPSFLSPSTIPRVFVFKRHKRRIVEEKQEENEDRTGSLNTIGKKICTSTIIPLLQETEQQKERPEGKQNGERNGKEVDKTWRLITSGQSPLLFFASEMLLVEGESDYIFATALKQLLLTHEHLLQKYIEIKTGEHTTESDEATGRMKCFLCSLHIVPMVGEANKFHYHSFCTRLRQRIFFLMDRDALTSNIPGQDPACKSPKRFLELLSLPADVANEVENDVSVLEKHGLFIWKGKIENAVASLAERCKFKTFLKKNNVHLDYNGNGKKGKPGSNKPSENKQSTVTSISLISPSQSDLGEIGSHTSEYCDESETKASGSENDSEDRMVHKLTEHVGDEIASTELTGDTSTNTKASKVADDSSSKDRSDVDVGMARAQLTGDTSTTEDEKKVSDDPSTKDGSGKLCTKSVNPRDASTCNKTSNKKKKQKPGKIFSNTMLTNKNIRTVVEKIVNESVEDRESEIRRLIMFLIEISGKYETTPY